MSESPYLCRRCKGQSCFLFVLDRPHRPTLIRCRACGHKEIL